MELLQGPRLPLLPPHQPRSPNSLVAHLSSRHNLKRAFAAAVFLVERNSKALSFDTLDAVFRAMDSAGTLAPALRPCENRVQKLIFPAIFYLGPAPVPDYEKEWWICCLLAGFRRKLPPCFG